MKRVRLKIDLSGTVGNAAWVELRHMPDILSGCFSAEEGSSGPCAHAEDEPHAEGEWCGAVIEVENHLLADYAVAHYLEQPRVLDAYLESEREDDG